MCAVHTRVCVFVCLYVRVCWCVYAYVCVCVGGHKESKKVAKGSEITISVRGYQNEGKMKYVFC